MAELGIAYYPPLGEMSVGEILQWAHLRDASGDAMPTVELRGGMKVRARRHFPWSLARGSSVLLTQDRLVVSAVVLETGADYSLRSRDVEALDAPSELIWPQVDGPPCPGALSPALATLLTGLRTESAARLRLRWALDAFVAASERDGLSGATWVDVSLVPHQLAAVAQVLTSPSIRHLLADEVGLGKTIEAIMIWSALRAQNPQLQALIAVPRSLVPQWCFELHRRVEREVRSPWWVGMPRIFAADAEGAYEAFESPEPGRPIVTDHGALERLVDLSLDLLVVDESHALNARQRTAVDRLAARAKHLLLLTGTPRDARRRVGARARARSVEMTPFLWALRLVDPKIPPDADPADVLPMLESALELGVVVRRAQRGDAVALGELSDVAESTGANTDRTPLESRVRSRGAPLSSRAWCAPEGAGSPTNS